MDFTFLSSAIAHGWSLSLFPSFTFCPPFPSIAPPPAVSCLLPNHKSNMMSFSALDISHFHLAHFYTTHILNFAFASVTTIGVRNHYLGEYQGL